MSCTPSFLWSILNVWCLLEGGRLTLGPKAWDEAAKTSADEKKPHLQQLDNRQEAGTHAQAHVSSNVPCTVNKIIAGLWPEI